MRRDLVAFSLLAFAVYILVFSVNFQIPKEDCSVSESESNNVKMCMNTEVTSKVTKDYLFDLIELPVYRYGFNIESVHYLFFILDSLILTSGLLLDKH